MNKIIKKFLSRFNLERDKYFTKDRDELAGQFNGNSCKILMDNIDTLEEYLRAEEEALRIAMPILKAMKAFNIVRKKCFSVRKELPPTLVLLPPTITK